MCAEILGAQAISSNSLLDVGNSHGAIHVISENILCALESLVK